MTSITGYLLVGLGTLLTFGGTVQTFATLSSLEHVLLWGCVALFGVFVLGFGVGKVLTSSRTRERPDPEKAPGKT